MKKSLLKNIAVILSLVIITGYKTKLCYLNACAANQTTTASYTRKTTTSTQTTTVTSATTTAAHVTGTSDSSSATLQTVTSPTLTKEQKNSIAMLNYLAMVSQEINAEKNNRIYLEEIYQLLKNNTNPEKVDETTKEYLNHLLDTLYNYRMQDEKRKQLQYIYEQEKATAMKKAAAEGVSAAASGINSGNKSGGINTVEIAAAAVQGTATFYGNYAGYTAEAEENYLKSGWNLDAQEIQTLHESKKEAFGYMIDIVHQQNLSGKMTLNEKNIDDFVTCKNNKNNYQRIQFLESEQNTYQSFGNYWLLLAECYFQNQDYRKCLNAISKYETLQIDIFRKDYYLAKTLPYGIIAASEIYSGKAFVSTAEKYIETIIENTENSDWSLRYFAAQMYVRLYDETKSMPYLRKAYQLTLDNVNNLTAQQTTLNNSYLSEIQEISIPDGTPKEEKKEIKNYNKQLKNKRKTELPVIYEPLSLNCELLFSIAKKLPLSQAEKKRVEGILQSSETSVFLIKPITNLYTFYPEKIAVTAEFDKDKLILPVSCVSENSIIKVTISDGNMTKDYIDWILEEVERPSANFNSFTAVYHSKTAGKYPWNENTTVTIEIFDLQYPKSEHIYLKFIVCNYKKILLTKKFDLIQTTAT